MEDKIIAGLDIGTTKICVIVGRKNEYGKLEILGMGKAVSDGVLNGIVININKTVRAIKKAVEEASKQSGINIRVVNVGIAGKHINSILRSGGITLQNKEEEITMEDVVRLKNDMYRSVIPPDSAIIHVMPQDYTIDDREGIIDPVGMNGVKLGADFHIITAQIKAVNYINQCVQRAGLEIANLILEPIASGLSVLDEEEKEAGVCLVDIGGGTTDIAIFYKQIIRRVAVIPYGGNIITLDIQQGCRVIENQAELLKTKYGKAITEETSSNKVVAIPGLRDRPTKEIPIKKLASIIQARMEEIIEVVHKEIVISGYHKKLVAGIIVTGGGSQLSHIKQLFEYMTGLETRIGHPNEHLGKSKIEAVKSPMYATGVGLVLSGFKAMDVRETGYGGSDLIEEKKKSGTNFFHNLLEKTKDLLFDDFDDKIN